MNILDTMIKLLVVLGGLVIGPWLAAKLYSFGREFWRVVCHACWVDAERNSRKGTSRGASTSVILVHTCWRRIFRVDR